MKYQLHKEDGNLILYCYYPQGHGETGIVSVNKKTGETAVVSPSADDFGNRFAFKLCKRLKEFFEAKSYKENGIIAWY
ncbi:MAG: hypothetical protein E7467_06950 [Ruminococcaceae bacterium]|nr:hypothetical protein [Oscillospiraceae bacterium]